MDSHFEQARLQERLQLMAESGATLSQLDAEIDHSSEPMSDTEREENWLYSWALVKRYERGLLSAGRKEEYGDHSGAG
jgi:hypothetical protein